MPCVSHASAQPRNVHPLFFTVVYVTKYCNSYTWTGNTYTKKVTINWDVTQHIQQGQRTTYQLLCNRKNNISKDSGKVLSSIKKIQYCYRFLAVIQVCHSNPYIQQQNATVTQLQGKTF